MIELIRSKRFWVSVTAVITIIGGALFPSHLTEALAIAGILQSWVLGESYRPVIGGKPNVQRVLVIEETKKEL